MISSFRYCVKLIIPIALAGLTLDTPRACGEPPTQEGSDKLPLLMASVNAQAARRLRTSVEWKDAKYDLDSGIDVVMSVVRDPEESAQERELALIQLAMLRTQLKGRPCLDELGRIYDKAEGLEKDLILICFLGSRDPRAIPVFVRTLDNQKNMKLRLSAASGLAGWNIRRGVAELVDLLDSKEVLPEPARMPYVRHNASESFRNANARKGWGFHYDETAQSIGIRTDLNDDQKIALHIAEVRKWFADNKHRFPDWKPGDPLPEAPVEAPRPKGSE